MFFFENRIFSTISFDLHIRILKSIAFLESTGNFRSKEYPQDYAKTIFYVFDGGRGSFFCGFRICCVSRHKKIAQRFSSGNIFENVSKGLYNAFMQ